MEDAMPYSEPVLTSYGPIVSLTHSPKDKDKDKDKGGKGKGRDKSGNESEDN